jgi:hypothetical protein
MAPGAYIRWMIRLSTPVHALSGSRSEITRAGRLGLLALSFGLSGCLDDGNEGEARRSADVNRSVREVRVDPEEARRVASVNLTRRLPRPVVATCRQASRETSLRVRVVCPPLVPDVRIVTEKDNPHLSVPFPPNWYDMTFNTAAPEPRHWVVGVGRPKAASQNVLSDRFHVVKGLPKLVKRLRVGREQVALYWYPPPGGAMNEGHVIAFVRMRGLSLWASIHGRRYGDAAVAMALEMARTVRTG